MVVSQGDVVWVDFPPPRGSGPGFRRPAVIVQSDALNKTALSTIICVPLTSNLRWADALGNVLLVARATGLEKDSVANVSMIASVDRALVTERAGKLSRSALQAVI